MAHFGFLIPPFYGHLRPACVLASELQDRGHCTSVITFADACSFVESRGITAVTFGNRYFPRGEWDRRTAEMGAAEGREVYRHSYSIILDQARSIIEDLPALLPKLKLDGLVMDQLCYSAESVAEACRIPLVVACNALLFHRESRVPLCIRHLPYNPSLWARARNRIDGAFNLLWGWRLSAFYLRHRRQLGLSRPKLSDLNEVPPSLAQIAQIPEFLDFPRRRLPSHFHYTGPWLDPEDTTECEFPWQRLNGKPVIYASLGTLQNRVDRLYRIIAQACAGLPVQLVLSLGRSGNLEGLAGAPLLIHFAPQRQLLRRAELMITHAGLNSALECVASGVPMVAIPLAHEQPGVAARMKRAGVADVLHPAHLSAETLRRSIQQVSEHRVFRERAEALAARLRDVNGPAQAVDIIEMACSSREKVARQHGATAALRAR